MTSHSLLCQRLLAVLLLFAAPAWGQPGTITTIAGGFTGDGGLAVMAGLNGPSGMALASDGTLYIADTNSHRVRRVSPDGMISTYAGNGTTGYTGDGGPAAVAQLNFPSGLALGPDGSLYIADSSNHVVRRVDPEGTIATFAGTGKDEFGGDGGPANAARLRNPAGIVLDASGRLYIVDSINSRIRIVDETGAISTVAGTNASGSGGDGGPAASAQLSYPQSVALVGDGSYFIGDRGTCRIRFVDKDGTISTFANPCQFGGGTLGLALGKRGLYVAVQARIMLVDWDGKVSVFAGSGGISNHAVEGESAGGFVVYGSHSLVVTKDETVYYSDNTNQKVRKIISGKVYTVAGTGGALGDEGRSTGDGAAATSAKLNTPSALQFADDGALYVADRSNARVRRVDVDGTISTIAGSGVFGFSGDGGSATEALLNGPDGLAMGDGVLYIADYSNGRVRTLTPDGKISTFAGSGGGGFAGDGGPATLAKIGGAQALARGKDGTTFIADNNNNRIRAVTPDGIISTFAGNGTFGFKGDGGPATDTSLGGATGLAVAEDGALIFADSQNGRVRRVGTDGVISTIAGTGAFGFTGDGGPASLAAIGPNAVTLAPDGTLYIADFRNNRIRKVDVDGIISTVAGSGVLGFGGDNGPAIDAKLYGVGALAIGPDGALYFADTGNNRVRRVELPAATSSMRAKLPRPRE